MPTKRNESNEPAPIKKRCTVPGCKRPIIAKGLCNTHYMRLYRNEESNRLKTVEWSRAYRERKRLEREAEEGAS